MYDHKTIEKKWQKKWEESKIYKTGEDKNKPKYYVLDMFPYPSGDGLHVGHPKGYVATDVVARFKMMNGFNVLHPMGWDAFGLPAENYALKTKTHPKIATQKNIQRFKEQLKVLGLTYDWEREINTTDPKYYKWTQWIFLQLLKHGLAYESYKPINWCPSCQTGLANEDLEDGKCERCGSEVEQKPMRQWVLKITDYAEKMLDGLKDLDWENSIIQMQKNWIGKSEGATVNFQIANYKLQKNFDQNSKNNVIFVHGSNSTEEESKRGGLENERHWKPWLKRELEENGFSVSNQLYPKDWAPEYEEWKNVFEQNNINENTILIGNSAGCAFLLRWLMEKKKKINKLILVAPSVLYTKRTERLKELKNFEFDNTLNNFFDELIVYYSGDDKEDIVESAKVVNKKLGGKIFNLINRGHFISEDMFPELLNEILDKKQIKVFTTRPDTLFGATYCVLSPEHELLKELESSIENLEEVKNYQEQARKKTQLERTDLNKDKTGVELKGVKAINPVNNEELPIFIADYVLTGYGTGAIMAVPAHDERDFEFAEKYNIAIRQVVKPEKDNQNEKCFAGDGININSDFLNGLSTPEAKQKITDWLEEKKVGKKTINYRLQDWVFSRQRYWGEPIPVIHCEKCGVVAVPENQLPVELPEVENYEPTGTGESPLANIEEWVNTTCPACGGPAKRETNTMPQWAGSCWYYLRYIDPANNDAMVDAEKEKYWQPVDLYVGGAEHATRHLIYARFWHRFLYDIGAVSTPEPFTKLQHVGLIMGEDSRKMSKRWGNVVNPDDVVEQYGADSLRVYEMFMGPFDNAIAWSTQSLIGARRFLDKIEKISEKVSSQELKNKNTKLTSLLHKTIKKVGEDIQNLKFNTAISAMMILINEMEKERELLADEYQKLIMIISPFAPHLAEELWEKLGNTESIFKNGWPKYDENLIKDEEVELIIQINGKMRDKILVNTNISDEDAKQQALSSEKIKKYLENQEVKKIIVVKGRLVSIVI